MADKEKIGDRTLQRIETLAELNVRMDHVEGTISDLKSAMKKADEKQDVVENCVTQLRTEMRGARWLACAIGSVVITGIGGILFATLSDRTAPSPTEIEKKMDQQNADMRELIEAIKKGG